MHPILLHPWCNLFYCILGAIYYTASLVQPILVHPWCNLFYCIIGASYSTASLVQPILLHPWCNLFYCILGATYFTASLVQPILLHPWCNLFYCELFIASFLCAHYTLRTCLDNLETILRRHCFSEEPPHQIYYCYYYSARFIQVYIHDFLSMLFQ